VIHLSAGNNITEELSNFFSRAGGGAARSVSARASILKHEMARSRNPEIVFLARAGSPKSRLGIQRDCNHRDSNPHRGSLLRHLARLQILFTGRVRGREIGLSSGNAAKELKGAGEECEGDGGSGFLPPVTRRFATGYPPGSGLEKGSHLCYNPEYLPVH
jgi:hypothetical protein